MSENIRATRQLFRIRNEGNNGFRRTYSDTYTFIDPESYDQSLINPAPRQRSRQRATHINPESLTQTTIPITEISTKLFEFIVKIIKNPDYIYSLIPNTSRLSMKQRHHKIATLITWLLMIMKKLSINNENIPQYIRLFDEFERTIGIHIMNENWFDNDPVHQAIIRYLMTQWFYFKYIPNV